jgi:hypothetical protein
MGRQSAIRSLPLAVGNDDAGVGEVDPFDVQHLAVKLDLTSCLSHQTGEIDPPDL